ncbi:MAG TPA: NAD(P)-dependent oxidoreductase [Chitinispirillaceae bacterium]|nr:NAD(P)-dependent oxidoreductase [Chitinispirillaceae bacterium]
MKKLLITGSSGFLGWNCCRNAASLYDVIGVYNSHERQVSGIHYLKGDITNKDDLKRLLDISEPEIVLHTAAVAAPNRCEEEPVYSHKVNVEASIMLAGLCSKHSVKFVFTSSDQVFSGKEAPYTESAPVAPLNTYGKQKAEAEIGIAEKCPCAAICRMPLMFGDAPSGTTSFIIPWIDTLRKGTELNLFTDEMRTPVSARDAAKGLLLAAEKITGIVHLGGKERLSRYEMGIRLSEAAGFTTNSIKGCKQSEIKMAAARPLDVSMDSSKAFAAGYDPGLFIDELRYLNVIQANFGV